MRIRGWAVLTSVAIVALALVALPSVGGQARTGVPPGPPLAPQVAAPPSPAVAAPAPQAPPDCEDFVGSLPPDLEAKLESIQRELESKMPGLEAKIAREVAAMDTEKLSRLNDEVNAALAGRQAEIESRAEEAAARAEEMAQEVAPEGPPQAWVFDSGDEAGWVGVDVGEVTAEKAKELKLPAVRGVLVAEVEPDSPASKAGVKSGDVITEYDGQTVEGVVQFRRLVRETPAGRTISLTVWRDGSAQTLSVEIGSRNHAMSMRMPHALGAPMPPNFDFNFRMPEFFVGATPMLGINVEDLSGQLGEYFGAPGGEGVLVREVRSGTPAEKAGLKAGDVVLKVDDHAVKTVGDLREQLREKREQKTVKLDILRKGAPMSLTVELEQPKHIEHQHATRRAVL